MGPIDKLKIAVTKTANGKHEYVQIMSHDNFTVNVVLLAEQIEVLDTRPKGKKPWPRRTRG